MNTADMADEIARLRKERDELKRQLGRHTIEAGAAEQRMAESNAVREALGFSADDENVSPNDLRDAIARRDARMKTQAMHDMAVLMGPGGGDYDAAESISMAISGPAQQPSGIRCMRAAEAAFKEAARLHEHWSKQAGGEA